MTTRTNGYSLAIEDPHPELDPLARVLAILASIVAIALTAIATSRLRPKWRP